MPVEVAPRAAHEEAHTFTAPHGRADNRLVLAKSHTDVRAALSGAPASPDQTPLVLRSQYGTARKRAFVLVPFQPDEADVRRLTTNNNGHTATEVVSAAPKDGPHMRVYQSGLIAPDSDTRDAEPIRPLPRGVDAYFVDRDPRKGLDLEHPRMEAVDTYIDNRLDKLIIRAHERNKELLKDKHYLQPMLIHRFGLVPPEGENEVTQAQLLEALTAHMVVDKVRYEDPKGVYYLPYDDMQPNDQVFKNKRFGWDTEMHVAAVLHSDLPDKTAIAKSSLRNAKYLYDVLGYVPNAAARGLDDRTQPPRHTKTLRLIYDAMSSVERNTAENQAFFREMFDFAEREYWTVFNAKDPENPYSSDDPLHQQVVKDGAIHTRYGSFDAAVYHTTSELSTGRDFTSDMNHRAADHTRIDLHTDLHNYEGDLAWWSEKTGNTDRSHFWQDRMKLRAKQVMDFHFDPDTNWFYHYDFKNGRQSRVAPVTGITALRMIDDPTTRDAVLRTFEETFVHAYGIGLTDPNTLPRRPSDDALAAIEGDAGMRQTISELYTPGQWDGDNQFYNTTKSVVDELLDADEIPLATRVMESAMVGLVRYFEIKEAVTGTGRLAEKLDSVNGNMGQGAEYGDQDELMMPMGAFRYFRNKLSVMRIQTQLQDRFPGK